MKKLRPLIFLPFAIFVISLLYFTGCSFIDDFINDTLTGNAGDTLWTYQLQDAGFHISSSPLAIGPDGTIYFAAGGGGWNSTDWEPQRIFALNKSDGSLKWKSEQLETWHINSYIVIGDDGTIYVSSATKLYSINPNNGSFNWVWEVPQTLPNGTGSDVYTYGELGPIALASDGSIITKTSGSGSYSRALYNISTSGNINWYYFIYSTPAGTPISVGNNGTIYIFDFTNSNNMYCIRAINPDNGELIWETTANIMEYANNIVIANNGDIIAFVAQDSLARIDYSNHQITWKINVDSHKNKFIDNNGNLIVFNQYTGSSLYNTSNGNLVNNSLTLPHDLLIDDNNQLYGVISDWSPHLSVTDISGNIQWESAMNINGGTIALSSDKVVYFISDNNIFALQADGALAHSGWPKFSHDNRNTFNATKW
ncbi:PQQ-binding-like beta-propeller repeat protein [candidate division WOR-3 bacterium]|uniref:Pyrrolo-quinoline quinone repeat domain-containing protein n=1 Tax=candidate division TA06 bacterium TaxID=2250710 RepID=A0A660SBM1_UNCT6|nr:PQQ-binding-like beta-propeller repeat protein [candidate division WOR-3 bacterium]RKX67098.1 MAG: hypothetical protein DRP44_02935 [candidate division TA06 bacterium]